MCCKFHVNTQLSNMQNKAVHNPDMNKNNTESFNISDVTNR